MMKSPRQPIVVIDDDDLDAEQTTDALRASGITREVIRLADGEQAIEYLGRIGASASVHVPPAFVLLDLKMPKLDGLDVLRFRATHPALRAIPVIVFTSSAYELDISRSVEFGANAYVVKPVDPREYGRAIAATGAFWSEFDRTMRC